MQTQDQRAAIIAKISEKRALFVSLSHINVARETHAEHLQAMANIRITEDKLLREISDLERQLDK